MICVFISLTETSRTLPISIGCFGLVRIESFIDCPQPCRALRFYFSNRNDPNFSETFRMLRMGSVRDFIVWPQQQCHANVVMYGGRHLWLRPIIVIHLIMKTRHCISGYDRIALWLRRIFDFRALLPRRFASSRGGTSLPRAERGGSNPLMTDLCKICF